MSDDDNTPDFDDVMRLARRWHYSEVRSLADEAIKECLKACATDDSDHARREWLTTWVDETTDGHSHVIYTGQASMLLAASDNEDAWEELGDSMPDVSARACMALRADVWELLEARDDEWKPGGDADADDGDES